MFAPLEPNGLKKIKNVTTKNDLKEVISFFNNAISKINNMEEVIIEHTSKLADISIRITNIENKSLINNNFNSILKELERRKISARSVILYNVSETYMNTSIYTDLDLIKNIFNSSVINLIGIG